MRRIGSRGRIRLQQGLRYLVQGEDTATPVEVNQVDAIADELAEWGRAMRGEGTPEVGGELATQSLAVVLAGVKSVREQRMVTVKEMYE